MDLNPDSDVQPDALVTALVDYSIAHGIAEPGDRTWAYNTLMSAIGEAQACGGPTAPEHLGMPAGTPSAGAGAGSLDARLPEIESPDVAFDLPKVLEELDSIAQGSGAAPEVGDGSAGIASWLLGLIMPRPSEVARRFESLRAKDPRQATTWFYHLCGDVGYVKRGAIARNIRWQARTRWGTLDMTINLSKPEKDPRAIARAAGGAGGQADVLYPACPLCIQNEGYAGRPPDDPRGPHPARQNLRIVPLELGGELWGLQYSPYAYFNEHCIAMSAEHRPMLIDRACLERLLDFADLFPHYFIGSNADLPIVGGSILSHDHFQGGRHIMPMEGAIVERELEIPGFPEVTAATLVWPLSVIRLRASDRRELGACAAHVLETWRGHDDPMAGIVARDADGRHNTITPIVRRHGAVYEMDLVLRCNVADEERPLGRFHPGPELWHLKKENIGLIEVMGLAILPPRLQRELAAVGEALLGNRDFESSPLAAPHARWASGIASRHPQLDAGNVESVLKQEAGAEFARVLEACGVFKWDESGRAAQARFLAEL